MSTTSLSRLGDCPMRRDLLFAVALSATVLVPQSAVAEEVHVYVWRDANGKAHYGDRCPAGANCRLIGMPFGATRGSSTLGQSTNRDAPSSNSSGSATSSASTAPLAGS